MALEKLKDLDRILNAFNSKAITNDDFEEKMQRVLALIKRFIQNTEEKAIRAEAKADAALRAVSEQHNLSLGELKKQTNQLFVGERLDSMSEGTRAQFEGLQGLLDTKLTTLKSGKDGDTPNTEQLLALISPLIKIPDLTQFQKDHEVFKKDHEELKRKMRLISRSGGGSRFGNTGPNANAVLIHIVSNQCDGENRRFTMPMARRVYKFEMSQHPFNLYEDTTSETHGFTVGDRSLTLNSAAPAPQRGQSAAIHYLK